MVLSPILATTGDLSSITLWFHKIKTVLTFPFAPEGAAIRRSERKNDIFYNWSKTGYMKLTPGNAIDYDAMAKKIDELHIDFNILKYLKYAKDNKVSEETSFS